MVRHLIFCGHNAGVFGNETSMAGWLNIYCYGSKPDHYPGFSHGFPQKTWYTCHMHIMSSPGKGRTTINYHAEVSWNGGTSKSSILKKIFSLINHPFFGYLHLWKPPCSFSWIFLLFLVSRLGCQKDIALSHPHRQVACLIPAVCLWTGGPDVFFFEGGVRGGMTCRKWLVFSNKSKWVMAVTVENHPMGIW